MTITNYTFFSPNGDDFPVTANADGKLYMMLTAMDYSSIRCRHWKSPINTALNRIYTNTSIVLGGRYFELSDHSITLMPNTTNFIHAVIDLSNPLNPVTITVENSNNSNTTDVNNNSGVLKRVFDIVVTSTTIVTSATLAEQVYNMPSITSNNITVPTGGTISYPRTKTTLVSNNMSGISIYKDGNTVSIRLAGTVTTEVSNGVLIGSIPSGYRPDTDWHFYCFGAGKMYRILVRADGGLQASQDIPSGTAFRDTINYII
ncbi:hypothetical protein [Brucella sp. CMUL 015]|uniref:hypothetical protein n=1 Tax=Brucella sp. CMUL 015 TaxID=1905697 RepID=UPI000B1A5F56|nr:hypothetical protein [Brucella sp. CMUL 015]